MAKILTDIDIICLTGGKCGSSTLNRTFILNGYKSIKVHYKADFIEQFKYDGLIDLINNSSRTKKIYLIDSYRTPIERKISSFFENIHHHVPNYLDKSTEELIDIFNKKYIKHIEEYNSINPIMLEYGLELFDTFDFNKGYVIKEKNNIVFIKILFSDIKKWDIILSNILNKKIIIYNCNISSNKNYYSLYEEFKIKYKVPKSYLNDLKNNVDFNIFNTKIQQEKYIDKWSLNSI
jgi:hypothetical protein